MTLDDPGAPNGNKEDPTKRTDKRTAGVIRSQTFSWGTSKPEREREPERERDRDDLKVWKNT